MDTHSCKSVLIDLFNLPPLPNGQNKEESYMDVSNNYYIPDGKNSRLLDRTDRVEFDREIIGGNTGFRLEIPYLECACSTKYFVMDKFTGSMMGIYDDKVKQIELQGQLKPLNINQLDRVMHIIGQRRLGLDTSSILTDEIPVDTHEGQSANRRNILPPLNDLICFRSTKTWNMMESCLQQSKGPKCTRTGSSLLQKWLTHCIYFLGVYFLIQKWQSNTIAAVTNT